MGAGAVSADPTVMWFTGFNSQDSVMLADSNISSVYIDDTVATPYPDIDPWYLGLPDGDPKLYGMTGQPWSCSEPMLYSAVVQFTNDISPSVLIDFMAAVTNKYYDQHWALRLATNGDLQLRDANGDYAGVGNVPWVADTWYVIQVLWERGPSTTVKVWVDGTLYIDADEVDTQNGVSTVCDIRFQGMQGMVGYPTYCLIDAAYVMYDVTDETDGPCNYYVTGPYSTYHNTTTSDQGTNLTAGPWLNLAEFPFNSSNRITLPPPPFTYSDKRCDGASYAGPVGDAAVENGIIWAAGWVVRAYANSSYLRGGKYDGSTYTMFTDSQLLTSLADDRMVFKNASASVVPDATETAVIGGVCDTGGLGCDWVGAFTVMLIEPTVGGISPKINAEMIPSTRLNEGLVR